MKALVWTKNDDGSESGEYLGEKITLRNEDGLWSYSLGDKKSSGYVRREYAIEDALNEISGSKTTNERVSDGS